MKEKPCLAMLDMKYLREVEGFEDGGCSQHVE